MYILEWVATSEILSKWAQLFLGPSDTYTNLFKTFCILYFWNTLVASRARAHREKHPAICNCGYYQNISNILPDLLSLHHKYK